MAFHSYVAGERPTAAQWNDWIGRRVVADATSASRPSSPVTGQPIYETDTGNIMVYNGSSWVQYSGSKLYTAWTSYTPTWATSGTSPAIGNGTLTGYYRQTGKTLDLWISLVAGSTTTFGTGGWNFTLPASLTAARASMGQGQILMAPAGTLYAGTTQVQSGILYIYGATSSAAAVTATFPNTWANGNYFYCTVRVEVA